MRKILLLLFIFSYLPNIAQENRADELQAIPPPAGLSFLEAIDPDNDGYTSFNIQAKMAQFKAMPTAAGFFNYNLSGYNLQTYAEQSNGTSTLIATPFYTNSSPNQACYMTATYSGSGPQYNQNSINAYMQTYGHFTLLIISSTADADADGLSNLKEDLNGNFDLLDDNTDGTGNPNYRDNDDDDDGILTFNEDYNGNGNAEDDDMNLNGVPDYLDFSARGALPLNLKLFIEGYYTYAGSGMMRPVAFNKDGVSPLTDVENITVELHRTSAPYELVASTTAMLKTNGTLACSFPTASVGSYYIAVKSPNGLETWSASTRSISNVASTYDFTNSANKAYGGNMKNVGGLFFALYSGDFNNDGFLDLGDYMFWETDNNAFSSGSYATDFNGDGFVDLADYSLWETNNNNFVTIVKPE